MGLRENFPPYGSTVLGGKSDGVVYRTAFRGTSLTATLAMVRQFLYEEGYGDVPIPSTDLEMLQFLQPEQGCHPNLFERPAYAHNPVRIVLPARDRLRKKLLVELYNEAAPDHLLRFHRRQCQNREERILQAIEEQHTEQYGDLIHQLSSGEL